MNRRPIHQPSKTPDLAADGPVKPGTDPVQRALQAALRFLGHRARSRAEMAQYLSGKGYGERVTETVLQRLAEKDLIDDAAFSRDWVASRLRTRPRSARAMEMELRQKGVDSRDIAAAVSRVDEPAAAWDAITPRLRHWAGLEKADFEKKAIPFLMRRGFSGEVSRSTADRAWARLHLEDETPES